MLAFKAPESPDDDDELLKQLIASDPRPRNVRRITRMWRKLDRPTREWVVKSRAYLNRTRYEAYRRNGDERYIPYLDTFMRRESWIEVPLEKLRPRRPAHKAAPSSSRSAETEAAAAANRDMFARSQELRAQLKASGKYSNPADLEAELDRLMEARARASG